MSSDYVATIRGQSAVGPMQSKKLQMTRFYTSALGAEPCICARPLLSMESSEISTFSCRPHRSTQADCSVQQLPDGFSAGV